MIIEHGQYLHLREKMFPISFVSTKRDICFIIISEESSGQTTISLLRPRIALFTPITPTRFFWRKKSRNIRLLGISI